MSRKRCSVDGLPPIGSVGVDYRADCTKCGRRVGVTKGGRYAPHSAPVAAPMSRKRKGAEAWEVFDGSAGESWLFGDRREAMDKLADLRESAADSGETPETGIIHLVERSASVDAAARTAPALGRGRGSAAAFLLELNEAIARHLKAKKSTTDRK